MPKTIVCPPKSREWQRLVSDLGESKAYASFFRNDHSIPDIESALGHLGMDKSAWRDSKGRTLPQVQQLDKMAKAVKEATADEPMLPKEIPVGDGKSDIDLARDTLKDEGQLSVSLVQRKNSMGYERAKAAVKFLEDSGEISRPSALDSYKATTPEPTVAKNATVQSGSGFNPPKMPDKFNSLEDALKYRNEYKNAEIEFYKSLGLTDAEAQKFFRAGDARSNVDVSSLEHKMTPENRDRLDKFSTGEGSEMYQWDKQYNPEELLHENDKSELAKHIVQNLSKESSPNELGDKLIHAAVALKKFTELGGTWSDIARELDGHTTRNSSSQGDKVEFFKTIGARIKTFAERQGIGLSEGDMGRSATSLNAQKYRIGKNPTLHTLLEKLPATEIEKENGEQAVRVKNDKTGEETTVLESQLTPITERSDAKRPTKLSVKELNAELEKAGLDPSEFPNAKSKKSMLDRLESLKMDTRGQLHAFGLVPEVWNKLIDLVKVGVQGGMALNDAVKSAISKIKEQFPDKKFQETDAALHIIENSDDLDALKEFENGGQVTSGDFSELSDEGGKTQIAGEKLNSTTAQRADLFSDAQKTEGFKRAQNFASLSKIPGQADNDKGGIIFKVDGNSNLDGDGNKLFTYDAEVRKNILEPLTQAIQNGDQVLATQIAKMVNYNGGEWEKIISKPLADELRGIAGYQSSLAGQILRMFRAFGQKGDLESIAKNLTFALKRVWGNQFGGDAVETFTKRVVENFENYFTPEELEKMSKDFPSIQHSVDVMAATARAESANRLYKKIQSRLNPKNITPAQLEKNAIAKEEFDALIEFLEKSGVDVPEKKNPKLTAREKLLLLVKGQTVEKVNEDVQDAIKAGLTEAGRQAARNETLGNKDALDELEARFSAGEEPTLQQVEKGLQLKAFRGIKNLRDNWLGYDPISTKLAREIISGDFKGVKFGQPKVKPADTRIDIKALAKEPDAEVNRVLEAYLKNVEDNADLSNATPETKQRIRGMIEGEVSAQIAQKRSELRDKIFAEPKVKGTPKTNEQKIAEQINAKLFSDPRLDIPEMVAKVANKGIIKNLTPSVSEIAKSFLESPSFKQKDIEKQIVQKVMSDIGIDKAQAEKFAAVLYKSLEPKIVEARKLAMEKAKGSFTELEKKVMPVGNKSRWTKIEQFFNAGGSDPGELLKEFAKENKYAVPTDAEVARMKSYADKIQELKSITPAKETAIRNDPNLTDEEKSVEIERENQKQESVNASQIAPLVVKMAVEWARLTKPFHKFENWGGAGFEIATANLLAKYGFPIRLTTHILTQLTVLTPTRPLALSWRQYADDKAAGRQTHLTEDTYTGLRDTFQQAIKAFPQAVRGARAQFMGRGEINASRLAGSVNALNRIAAKAEEHYAKKDYVRANMYMLVGWLKYAQRVVAAIDAFQGEFVESMELRNQIFRELAQQGKSREEIKTKIESVLGNMQAEWTISLADARRMFDERGIEPSENIIREAADRLLKDRMYQKVQLLGLDPTSMRSYILRQRMAQAWQEPTLQGLGGAVNKGMLEMRKFATDKGFPFLPLEFSNAIGAGINYHLMMTPLYKAATGKVDAFGVGKSAWNETPLDRTHRQVMAIAGTLLGSAVIALILDHTLKVNLHYPTDKKEREKFINEGHKIGTVEWQLKDGSFIPMSLTVGPMAVIAPYIAGGGAYVNLMDKRAAEQEKLNKEALAKGLTPGTIRPVSTAEVAGIFGAAVWSSIMGGSTAAGVTSAYSEFGVPNANKTVATTLSSLIPGLPMYQEISRMMGVALDPKNASIADYMVPLPTSNARLVNSLGDPVRTPNDVQRVVQAITAGTFLYPVKPTDVENVADARSNAAYAAMIDSGLKPPSISPSKAYSINGEYRPMNNAELNKYTELRGQYLKEGLSAIGSGATIQQAKQVYQEANQRALADVGIGKAQKTQQTASAAPIQSNYASAARPKTRKGSLRMAARKGAIRLRGSKVGSGLRFQSPIAKIKRGGSLIRKRSRRLLA